VTQNDPPLAKLPDGRFLAFTMEIRDWIDALLWEDEEHDPWTEQNLSLGYVADNASDGVPPERRGWELILECAKSDFENTKIQEFGEFCRELIFTITGEDPGEWHEKRARIVFESRFEQGGVPDPVIAGRHRGQQVHKDLFDQYLEMDHQEMMELMAKFMVKRRKK